MSSSIVIPSMDPRNERRTGSPEGLARRVTELERRVSNLTGAGSYNPPIFIATTGPAASASPPNAFAGTAFTVPMSGRYAVLGTNTGYRTTAQGIGPMYAEWYVDAVLITSSEVYANAVEQHMVLMPRMGLGVWTAGTHYLYQRAITCTTNGADPFGFYAFRIGALP